MTQVTILTGFAGAGKTERLLEHYRAALHRGRLERRLGTTLWLTPTQRIQRSISQQVLAKCGVTCFSRNVLTFDLFAEKILEAAGRPASPISPVMKRLLLRRITETLKDEGELLHFLPIAGTTGFLDIISSFISELKREEIWPEDFGVACRQRTSAFMRRDLEVGLIYSRYQQHLAEQNWYDNEGQFWLARTALGEGVRGSFASVRTLVVDGFADFTQTQYEILGYLAGWIDDVSISLPVEQPLARTDLFSKPYAAISRIRKHLPAETKCREERLQPDESDIAAAADSDREEPWPRTKIPRSRIGLPPNADSARREFRALGGESDCRFGWANSVRVVADRLFSNPRFVQPSSEVDGLEIIAATGQLGEWEAVARRIKALLSNGTEREIARSEHSSTVKRARPQDIVLGLRAISDDGPRLRDFLESAGLPVWCEAELPFTSSSIVRAVSSLLQLELEDWPFERLLAVLDSNFFQPTWPELESGRATRSVAASLRRLRLDSGRESMLRVLGRYAADTSTVSAKGGDSLSELARLASPLLLRLSRTLERLRRPHTLSDWADVLAAIANDFGWTKRSALTSDELRANESRDFDLMQGILRTAAVADQKLMGTTKARLLTLAEFTSELRDLLSHETLNSESEQGGCIRILGVEQIRNLDVPHLFLVGLTENSFPMNRSDDCLFSEAERRDFISHGIALRHRSGHHADEMFLFYSVVTRARRSLTLSYPAVNSKGQPVFPSPYVTALKDLFSPDAFTMTLEGQLDPVPSTDRALTFTDLRLAAMVEAGRGHPQLFRAVLELEPLRRTAWNTLAACEVAEHRFHQRGFTNYEGHLELPQNLNGLRQRFGSHHQFSATELESYARCPFQFWLSTVLKIGTVESPEEGTDFAGRGTLLHEVLAKLLIEGMQADSDALRTRFRELVDWQLDRHIPETELQRALVGIERLILNEWADAFVEQQTQYDESIRDNLKDIHSLSPEIPFGKLPDATTATLDAHPAIQFGHDAHSVNLRGRIDRVDVGSFEGHPAYVVIDYKTGQRPSLKKEDLIAGRSIQLALYLLAIKRLGLAGPDAVPHLMGYWTLRETGFKPGMSPAKLKPLDAAVIQSLETLLDDLLPRLAEGIRSGRFVVENDDPNCTGRCPYRTACRVNQLRPLAELLGKQSPPPIDPTDSTGEGALRSEAS